MTSQEATLRRVTLYRGVYPIRLDIDDATSAEAEREILDELRRLGFVEEGESVIMTRGELTGVAGGTNSMKILLV